MLILPLYCRFRRAFFLAIIDSAVSRRDLLPLMPVIRFHFRQRCHYFSACYFRDADIFIISLDIIIDTPLILPFSIEVYAIAAHFRRRAACSRWLLLPSYAAPEIFVIFAIFASCRFAAMIFSMPLMPPLMPHSFRFRRRFSPAALFAATPAAIIVRHFRFIFIAAFIFHVAFDAFFRSFSFDV
jgi:hypothetical protein